MQQDMPGRAIPITAAATEAAPRPAITGATPRMSHTDASGVLRDVIDLRRDGSPDIAACIDAIDASTSHPADPSRHDRR